MVKRLARWVVPILSLMLLVGTGLILWLFWDLPSPEHLEAYTTAPSSKVYDRHGTLLFEIPPPYTGSHTPVPLSEIPDALKQATIVLEDETFYQNPGVDLRGIARALWYNLRDDSPYLMGGSTITQQLVRNLMMSPEERTAQTLRRKIREAWLAYRVTHRYTKDEIFAFYLNETYYGNLAYGVEAAAQAYYGKHVRDLDLAECAMLAILPHDPALWNPLENPEDAKVRQALALDRLVEERVITSEEAQAAKQEPLAFASAPFPIRAPHFVMIVRRFLERELGRAALEAGGLTIETTLDVELNETARDLMRTQLDRLARCNYEPACPPGGYNVRNAAVLALSPQTGEVLAMVGSPDYFSPLIDGAVNGTTVLRQPGSAIKPITYAAAFAQGKMTPATVVMDVRTAFTTREGTPYLPLNYDLVFHGPVRLREALASSYNVAAVKVLDAVGIETMTGLARSLGITTFDDSERLGLAITLGGGEVRLLELTAAYAALANQGHRVTPWTVRRVVDADGEVLWSHPCVAGTDGSTTRCLGPAVLDERVAYLITDILSDDQARVPTFGEESVLNLPYPASVKTGTTTDFRDNWTVGYTPELVVGVWVGNADNERMKRVSGITGAGPLWHDVMLTALKGKPVRSFIRPDGLTSVEVCALSGKLPTQDCPHRVHEWFIEGTAPQTTCEMHRRVGDEVFVILPPEAQAWAREHNLAQPPKPASTDAPGVQIMRPYTGTVYQLDPSLDRDAQRILVAIEAAGAVDQVTLTVDDRTVATLTAPPFTVYWPLVAGTHTFRAVVRQADGTTRPSAPVRIDVQP